MGHVFISYSRKDQSTARRLADDLRHHGYDVWMDDRIEYGGQWLKVIFEAIRESSAVIVLMSPEAEKSDWVEKEYLYAKQLQKLVLPLMLDEYIIPYFLNLQVSAITAEEGLPNKLYHQLEEVLTPQDQTGQMVITPILESKTHSSPSKFKKRRWAGVFVGGVAITALLGAIWLFDGDNDPSDSEISADDMTGTAAAKSPSLSEQATPSPTAEPIEEIAFVMDGEIYLMNADGSGRRNLTNNPSARDYEPDWSPDGSEITFTSYLNGDSEIYIMTADGTGLKNLSQFSASDVNPAWSPDGQTIAFYSERYQNYKIYGIGPDGSYLRRITEGGGITTNPSWSPDSKAIAFFSTRDGILDIYTMNVDGTELTRITDTPKDYEYEVRWSPDGTQIAFSFYVSGSNNDLFLVNADGSNLRNITNTTDTSERDPAWSPDGTQLAFTSSPASRGYVYGDIYIMSADGSNIRNITNTPGVSEYDPAWRPH